MKKELKIGQIVMSTDLDQTFRSGAQWYPDAIVLETNPFTLVSRDGTMRWDSFPADICMVVALASQDEMDAVLHRHPKRNSEYNNLQAVKDPIFEQSYWIIAYDDCSPMESALASYERKARREKIRADAVTNLQHLAENRMGTDSGSMTVDKALDLVLNHWTKGKPSDYAYQGTHAMWVLANEVEALRSSNQIRQNIVAELHDYIKAGTLTPALLEWHVGLLDLRVQDPPKAMDHPDD